MATAKGKASLIGSVGGIFIGAAILLFIVSIVLNNLRAVVPPGYTGNVAGTTSDSDLRASWNSTNSTIASLLGFFTITIILLGVMGITLVGGSIIGYITGMFGQSEEDYSLFLIFLYNQIYNDKNNLEDKKTMKHDLSIDAWKAPRIDGWRYKKMKTFRSQKKAEEYAKSLEEHGSGSLRSKRMPTLVQQVRIGLGLGFLYRVCIPIGKEQNETA